MPRKGSDNFGDQVSGPPAPNYVPSERAQLRRRHLNNTGLPEGVRDDVHSWDAEDENSEERDRQADVKATATATRTRRKRSTSRGTKEGSDSEKKEEDTDSLPVGSKGFSERLRSPLGSSLKLDELRETISKGVEIK